MWSTTFQGKSLLKRVMISLGKGLHGQLRISSFELQTHIRPSRTNNMFFSWYDMFAFVTHCSLIYESFIHTFVHFICTEQHKSTFVVVMVWCSLRLLSYSFLTESLWHILLSLWSTSPSTLELDVFLLCKSRRWVISASEQVAPC